VNVVKSSNEHENVITGQIRIYFEKTKLFCMPVNINRILNLKKKMNCSNTHTHTLAKTESLKLCCYFKFAEINDKTFGKTVTT